MGVGVKWIRIWMFANGVGQTKHVEQIFVLTGGKIIWQLFADKKTSGKKAFMDEIP